MSATLEAGDTEMSGGSEMSSVGDLNTGLLAPYLERFSGGAIYCVGQASAGLDDGGEVGS
jgi:hypothetical protein